MVREAGRLCIVTSSRRKSGRDDTIPKPAATAGGRPGRARVTAAAWTGCALGGGTACGLQDRAAVAVGLAVVVVIAACAAAGLGAVLLGGSDRRSPFTRFMLLACVLTGRPPGEYLPPGPGEH